LEPPRLIAHDSQQPGQRGPRFPPLLHVTVVKVPSIGVEKLACCVHAGKVVTNLEYSLIEIIE
jgi:hypothetical protein